MTAVATQRSVKTGFRLAVAAAVVAICGCAGGHGTLSEKVTYKGKTVASGNVVVVGAMESRATARLRLMAPIPWRIYPLAKQRSV